MVVLFHFVLWLIACLLLVKLVIDGLQKCWREKKNREIANLSLHQVCPAHYKLRIPELTVRPWAMILCNKVSTLSKIPSSWPGFFYFNKYIMVYSEMPFSKNSYRIETSQLIYFLARFCEMFSFYSNEHDVWFSNRRYRQLC